MFCKICEFSRLSGTSVDTLRHYERCGLLRPKIDSANGHRLYTASDFITLMNILTACMPLAMTAAAFSIPTRNPMSPAAARLLAGRLPPPSLRHQHSGIRHHASVKSSFSCLSSIAYIELTIVSNNGINGFCFGKSKFLILPSKSIEKLAITTPPNTNCFTEKSLT